jgi:hypothetical protein
MPGVVLTGGSNPNASYAERLDFVYQFVVN